MRRNKAPEPSTHHLLISYFSPKACRQTRIIFASLRFFGIGTAPVTRGNFNAGIPRTCAERGTGRRPPDGRRVLQRGSSPLAGPGPGRAFDIGAWELPRRTL